MTEVLVGLIAALPALLGYLNSRRRQLATIEAEISVYDALPKADKASRKAMRAEISDSVARYHSRKTRQNELMYALGWSVAWLLIVLGYNLYDGSPTNAETIKTYRQTGGLTLVVVGAGIFLIQLAIAAVRTYAAIRVWWLRRQIKGLQAQRAAAEARQAALEREIAATKHQAETQIAEIIAIEQRTIEAGGVPLPRPPQIAEVFAAYEAHGSLDGYEPSEELKATLKAQDDASPLDGEQPNP